MVKDFIRGLSEKSEASAWMSHSSLLIVLVDWDYFVTSCNIPVTSCVCPVHHDSHRLILNEIMATFITRLLLC